jgi:hypothetical protein
MEIMKPYTGTIYIIIYGDYETIYRYNIIIYGNLETKYWYNITIH